MKRFLPFLIILFVLAFAVVAGWYFTNRSTEPPRVADIPGASPTATSSTSAGTVPVATSAREPGATPPHAVGPANAPVTLEEFGDFQCPPCGQLHPELKQIVREYGPRVRLIYREFPLVPTHPHALAAARAAEAAGMQGKFWEMHGLIYETQRAWNDVFDVRPIFEEYARRIGLDVERFTRDLSSSTVERRIFLDGKRGHELGVKGTPTVFLNGREVPFDSLPAQRLRPLIDAELARAGP